MKEESKGITSIDGIILITEQLVIGESQIISRSYKNMEGFESVGLPVLVQTRSPHTAIPEAFKILLQSRMIPEQKMCAIKGAGYLTKKEVEDIVQLITLGYKASGGKEIAHTDLGEEIMVREKYVFGIQFYAWKQGPTCILKQGG